MVEAGERVGDQENTVGNLERIRVGLRQTLEIPSRFVSQVSDRAAAKAFGKTLGRFSGIGLQVGFQGAQRVCSLELAPATGLLHRGAATRDRDDRHPARSVEGVAPELATALDTLEDG